MRKGPETNSYGDVYWFDNDQLHRDDGPAIEWIDGEKWWYKNGKLHREDGPACHDTKNGRDQWWINGNQIDCQNKEEFEKFLKLKAFW